MAAKPASTDDGHRHLNGLTQALAGLDVERITLWGSELADRLSAGRTLLVAGNGGSAAEAQHLTAELVGRYKRERRGVAAIALHADSSTVTAVANDYGYEQVFARQVEAHARPGDVLLLLSTSGRSANLLRAAEAARAAGVTTWALTGPGPSPLTELADDAVTIDAATTANVQECHLVVAHLLAAAVEERLVEQQAADTPAVPAVPEPPALPAPVDGPTAALPARRTGTAKRLRVVVVGDTLLDRDSTGSVSRLSPEAPVPVLADLDVAERPGGAGLAAALSATGGVDVTLVTALSQDVSGAVLRSLFDDAGVRVVDLGLSGPTPVKSRIRTHDRTLLMLDEAGPAGEILSDNLEDVADALATADGILVSDYGRGVAALPAVRRLLAESTGRVPTVWDPHPLGAKAVPGVRLVTPNSREAAGLTGRQSVSGRDDLTLDIAAARDLLDQWRVEQVVVTRGMRGAVLMQRGAHTPLVVNSRRVIGHDACGAGDRFAATTTIQLAGGATPAAAVAAATEAATAYVENGGPRYVSDRPERNRSGAEDDALLLARQVRAAGGTVVAVGGCFDLLHRGHAAMLEEARQLGDCLIACINDDESVARLKGPDRPVLSAADRAAMLRSLRSVDAVLVFGEDTPEAALQSLRPDIFVKGGDYHATELPESETVRAWGGHVVTVPFVDGHSTTSLLDKLIPELPDSQTPRPWKSLISIQWPSGSSGNATASPPVRRGSSAI
ncbi:PfkB family carbohydrate kinase [Streptomyces canarius]